MFMFCRFARIGAKLHREGEKLFAANHAVTK